MQDKRSQRTNKESFQIQHKYKIGDFCYALHCGHRQGKHPRWIPAIVKKIWEHETSKYDCAQMGRFGNAMWNNSAHVMLHVTPHHRVLETTHLTPRQRGVQRQRQQRVQRPRQRRVQS